jgi:hypothetical protein
MREPLVSRLSILMLLQVHEHRWAKALVLLAARRAYLEVIRKASPRAIVRAPALQSMEHVAYTLTRIHAQLQQQQQ